MPLPAIAAATLALALLAGPGPTMATEEPAYRTIERDGRLELREYPPTVVAETVVDGELSTASTRGFRALAGYIFGGNRTVRDAGGAPEKIAMTRPVTAEPASERIAMTRPVTAEPQAAGGAPDADALPGATRWRIRFVMPSRYTLETLPRPDDPSVVLREEPAARMAVLRFSGLAGDATLREASAELLAWVGAKGWTPLGTPRLARYDPPWTLPPLRRNEVMVPVATGDGAR